MKAERGYDKKIYFHNAILTKQGIKGDKAQPLKLPSYCSALFFLFFNHNFGFSTPLLHSVLGNITNMSKLKTAWCQNIVQSRLNVKNCITGFIYFVKIK